VKRRNFIKLSATASAAMLLPNDLFALFKLAGIASIPDVNSKKLVLIQLIGANDGLNTIVPIDQYDTYANLRPTIKLSNTGPNRIITLDHTMAVGDQVGLHPSLTGFKNLYDSGFLRIVQGVGYPFQDKSHFKSTDLWLTGGDGSPGNNWLGSGWMGRFLENQYSDLIKAKYPLGIQLGGGANSLGFHGEKEHGMALNCTGQDPSLFYTTMNGVVGAAPGLFPDSEYGNLLKYISESDQLAKTYSATVASAFDKGSNSLPYPDSSLSQQLKTVARFISGGLETKVYLVKIQGFDTHDLQVANSTEPHLGKHANLMATLSEAIEPFIRDLTNQNRGDEVLAITFSEFGRKAAENANLGTDHGEVAPMFVFGKAISPGISGTNLNLSEAVKANNYQIQTVQFDYRSVFGTILQDWIGVDKKTLDLTFYNHSSNSSFANANSNLLKLKNH